MGKFADLKRDDNKRQQTWDSTSDKIFDLLNDLKEDVYPKAKILSSDEKGFQLKIPIDYDTLRSLVSKPCAIFVITEDERQIWVCIDPKDDSRILIVAQKILGLRSTYDYTSVSPTEYNLISSLKRAVNFLK